MSPALSSGRDRLLTLTAAVVFTAWLVGLQPHLVHHLFDGDHEPSCPYLALSEHTPQVAGASVDIPIVHAVGSIDASASVLAPRAPSVLLESPRAPPASSLSA
jgi:hypothetical protein